MNVLQYVAVLREKYVEALRQAIAKAKVEGTYLASEVLIRADGGVASGTGGAPAEGADGGRADTPTNQPTFLTVDLLTGTPEAPQPALLMRDPEEGPLVGAIQQGTIEVAIYPFLWEACRVWLRHPEPDWSPLEAWFKKWFEERLDAEPGADGLKSMVHLLSDPLAEGGGHLFQVDFGSAPVEAFTGMLEALDAMGATEVRVGHSDGSEMDPAISDELRSSTLTQDRFVTILAGLVRELEGVTAVEILEPAPQMVLRIKEEGMEEPSTSNLGNLWLVLQRTTPDHRPREVARYLRGQLESSQYRKLNQKPDLSTLRPVIKPTAFIEHVKSFAEKKGDQRLALFCTRFVGDLWIACVWDRPNGMQFVTSSEPEEFGLSHEEAYARALRNYLASRGAVETVTDRGVIVARTHDNYDASLLLDDAFWTDMSTKLPGTLLVCAPTRDAVLISSLDTPGGEAALRTLAREYLESGNHAISATVLRRQLNTWQVHVQGPTGRSVPPNDMEARSVPRASAQELPSAGRKKPWWKFW